MNEMQSGREKTAHEFSVVGRKKMTIDGVKDVIGFDETSVQLMTYNGDMTVEGNGLHILVLDVGRGVVTLEGRVDSVFYADPSSSEKRSFWERLVK